MPIITRMDHTSFILLLVQPRVTQTDLSNGSWKVFIIAMTALLSLIHKQKRKDGICMERGTDGMDRQLS